MSDVFYKAVFGCLCLLTAVCGLWAAIGFVVDSLTGEQEPEPDEWEQLDADEQAFVRWWSRN